MVNKSVELIVRPEAEEDIREAYRYYEEYSEGLGSDFLLSVDAGQSAVDCFSGSRTVCFIWIKKIKSLLSALCIVRERLKHGRIEDNCPLSFIKPAQVTTKIQQNHARYMTYMEK